MEIRLLTAISPIDGRYRNKVNELAPYFSEFALIKYRVLVEIEYFIALCDLPVPQLKEFNQKFYPLLRNLYKEFRIEDAEEVKEIEKVINHDVKAVEYFIKKKFDELKLSSYKEFIHFGLTSQDINNTAIPYSFRDALNDVYYPILEEIIKKLDHLSAQWEGIPMLARTHGQSASPTRLGKEIKVFAERLKKQLQFLKAIPCSAKFGGSTGNFNAHCVAYPEFNWIEFGNNFVNKILDLDRSQTTTQIEHYDNFAAIFDNLKRINTILIDLDRDFWTYISMDYFKLKIKSSEVGSSTMPHKINPIDFENSEGNLGMASSIYEHLAVKLPVSRLQRDLTDSTVLRNIGVPVAHTIVAFKSLLKGLEKVIVNESTIKTDLEKNWCVVAEAIQTILRREGYPKPYEVLKEITRTNKTISRETIHDFIENLNLNNEVKEELKKITPFNYTGI